MVQIKVRILSDGHWPVSVKVIVRICQQNVVCPIGKLLQDVLPSNGKDSTTIFLCTIAVMLCKKTIRSSYIFDAVVVMALLVEGGGGNVLLVDEIADGMEQFAVDCHDGVGVVTQVSQSIVPTQCNGAVRHVGKGHNLGSAGRGWSLLVD